MRDKTLRDVTFMKWVRNSCILILAGAFIPILLIGCEAAMKRNIETGAPEGWLAWTLDILGVLGDASLNIIEKPSAGGIVAGALAVYGGVMGLAQGKKGIAKVASVTSKVIAKKVNGSKAE
jgi:hypothetical protein